MNKWRYVAGGALVAGAGVAALLLGLPGVQAKGAPGLAVHGVDYGFQGVPGKLAAGEVRLSFTNDSKAEGHELSLFRINDGVSQSLDHILAEDEALQNQQGQGQQNPNQQQNQNPPPPKMTFFANTGAAPGQSAKLDLIGNLPAGRYGIVCFLPVANDEAGTPHYKKGMKAEFTVQ
ncbi:MAG TPA: hypothetical protein VG795_07860 [Acidimicrobiia bacterium]|nr:hypothetical protein [Acidimicrobiia bacterium]